MTGRQRLRRAWIDASSLLRMQRLLGSHERSGDALFTACYPTILVKHSRAGRDRNRRLVWISGFIVERSCREFPIRPSVRPFTAPAICIDRHRLTETGFH